MFRASLLWCWFLPARSELGQPCDPARHGQSACYADCSATTEWCAANATSPTGWACVRARRRGEVAAGEECVEAAGQKIYCNNCPEGYYCESGRCDALLEVRAGPSLDVVLPPVADARRTDLCSSCISLMYSSMEELIHYAFDVGVDEGCGRMCDHLAGKSERAACDVVCSSVGLGVFVKALKHADPDPIYVCETLRECRAGPDDASMLLKEAAATPSSVGPRRRVTVSLHIDVLEASGVGEILFSVHGPLSRMLSDTILLPDGLSSGKQTLYVSFEVKNDMHKEIPVVWVPGPHTFTFEVCQGKCGSEHPHSKSFGTLTGEFTVRPVESIVV
eukprot:TRINITY_DN9753_c3_g1_i1.p1 TRINITY_DN9753_c3_g1~~TRINITY_DN9753_c3_g1_i1.p1  ORF type:complete len:333 (-),score=43.46 TRINITY_DN9753_c3_g1_i1:653-1651(-)